MGLGKDSGGFGLAGWGREGPFLAADEAAEEEHRDGEPGDHDRVGTVEPRGQPLNCAPAQQLGRCGPPSGRMVALPSNRNNCKTGKV